MEERRKYRRIGISFPVECSIFSKKDYFCTVSKDLSMGGIKILSNDFLSKNLVLGLNINFIEKILNIRAKVAWCNKESYGDRYYAGLEFLELEENAKRYLQSFLNKISSP